jgi:hypothetical protein
MKAAIPQMPTRAVGQLRVACAKETKPWPFCKETPGLYSRFLNVA